MKNLLLSIALFCCASIVHAQADKKLILSNPQPIGQNLKTNTAIQGTSYIFESPISDISINAANNSAIVLLQHKSAYFNKGTLLDCNLNSSTVKWEKEINLNKEKINLSPGQAIVKNNKISYALNPADGAPSWQTNIDFFYIDPELNIGIGFPQKKFTVSNELSCIDFTDGKELWKKEIDHHFGINSVTLVNKSCLLIVADKMYAFDPKTGTGWEHNIITGSTHFMETTNQPVDNKYPIDTDFNFLQDGHTVCGLASSPVVKDSEIYIASDGLISCISTDGKVKWAQKLPEGVASRPRIFIENNRLYLISTGYVYFDNKKTMAGTPYVAAFDLKNGQQIFLTKLEKGFVADYEITNNTLSLILSKKLVQLNLTTGEIGRKENFELIERADIVAFTHVAYYTGEGTDYKKLVSNPERLYLVNERNKLVEYNLNTKTSGIIPAEKLYRESFEADGITCISQSKNSIILDKGQAVARLQMGMESFNIGNGIFYIADNMLYRVDINAITGK